MRSLKLTGPREFELVESEVPEPAAGQVRIKVAYAGICGSDLAIAQGGPIFGDDYTHPILGALGGHGFGHEFSGHLDALGEGVEGLELGTLVAVRANVWDGTCATCLRGDQHLCADGGFIGVHGGGGAFSDHVLVNPDQVHVLPHPFTEATGALVEPLAVGWHAVGRARLTADSTALVVGGGPVGLSVLLVLKAQGINRVLLSEPSSTRRELARSLGAEVIDPSTEDAAARVAQFAPGGVDASFEAAGINEGTFNAALTALRPRGTLVMVAMGHEAVPVHPLSLMLTEVNLTGSNAYADSDFTDVIEAVVAGRLDPTPLISSVIALADVATAGFDHLFAEGRSTEVKMLVRP